MTIKGYYRYPTIHKNKVVFVCEDDLWIMSGVSGIARRLTANLGLVSHPFLSPDGKLLAFVGREDGENEIYIMPAEGGSATRLTYLGSSTTVLGWTVDGKNILFASNAGQPFYKLTPLYSISPSGGQPQKLPYGPACSISYSSSGGVVIGRKATNLANWKRYRGGTAGDIWIDKKGKGNFKPLLKNLNSNLINPMWIDERIYFLSDHEGIGNIYSCSTDGKDIKRHTHHADFYVRNPTTDGQRIIYRAGAELYIFDPHKKDRKKSTIKINPKFYSPRIQSNRKFVKPSSYLEYYTVHPKGHSVSFTSRGKAFTMSNWGGAVIQHGQNEARYRLPEWLYDGQWLVMISDKSGEEVIELHADILNDTTSHHIEQLPGLDIGRPQFLKTSPVADSLILSNHRHELIYVDLQKKTTTLIDKSDYARIDSADWSPDGQWVVYSFKTSFYTSAIKLYNVTTGETQFITPPNNMYDINPNFGLNGKYIFFISYRHFDPVYDSHYFELSFPRGSRPYLITLQKELPNPFIPMPNEKSKKATADVPEKEQSNNDNDDKKDKDKKKKPPLIKIDLEGIQERIAAFPVPEGRYHQIKGVHKNKVLFTIFPIAGSLNNNNNNKNAIGKGALEIYDLIERKKDFVVSGINSFDVSQNREFIIYCSGKNIRVIKADEKPNNNSSGYTKKNGWIKLNRAVATINPPDEWRQMFREAWRLQRDHFWTENMSSVDWQLVYKRYYPLLERIATRTEFSDLLYEMQGELGTSHAYELGGDYRASPHYYQGFLGADFLYSPEMGGYIITHIVQGDSWSESVTSSLSRLGVNIKVGDLLLAIDGQPLTKNLSPQQLLVNRAYDELLLTVVTPPDPKGKKKKKDDNQPTPRTVIVKTLGNETKARYREWVENNRRQIHEKTNGRVGYVHVPDMSIFGYSEFHRYYLAESDREGLIVDVRFNGGGNVSQLLLEKLARRHIGYDQSRYGAIAPYPEHAVRGPIVALTNEFAGSDGDIFSHAFKLMELGPLIGKRTWGGVIGIWPRHSLADGTLTTQPEFSYWFKDVGWAVENYGTDPDIEVEIKPQDYAKGKDTQLERGIKEILKLLKENPPSTPEFGPRPNLSLPKLPDITD